MLSVKIEHLTAKKIVMLKLMVKVSHIFLHRYTILTKYIHIIINRNMHFWIWVSHTGGM
jgi:hypothetical protein